MIPGGRPGLTPVLLPFSRTPARAGRPRGGGRCQAEEEGGGARREQGHGEGQSREVGDR